MQAIVNAPATTVAAVASRPVPAARVPWVAEDVLDVTDIEVVPQLGTGSNPAGLVDVGDTRWRVKITGDAALSAMEMTLSRIFQLTGLQAPDSRLATGLSAQSNDTPLLDTDGECVQASGSNANTEASTQQAYQFASRYEASFVDLGEFLAGPHAPASFSADQNPQRQAYLQLQAQHQHVVTASDALLAASGAERPWQLSDPVATAQFADLDGQRFRLLEAMNRMLPADLRNEQARHYIASRWLNNWDHLNYRMENVGFTQHDGRWTAMTVDFGACGPIGFRDFQSGEMQPKSASSEIARQQRPAALFTLPDTSRARFDTLHDVPGALADITHWPYGAQSASVAGWLADPAAADTVAEMGYRLYLLPDQALAALVARDWHRPDTAADWPDAQSLVETLNRRRHALLDDIGPERVVAWMRQHPEAATEVRAQIAAGLTRALGPVDTRDAYRQAMERAHGELDTLEVSAPLPLADAPAVPDPAQRFAQALTLQARGQRTQQVLQLAEAFDAMAVLPPAGSSAILLQPDVAAGVAGVLRRQQERTEPETTLHMASLAAAGYDRAIAHALAEGQGQWIVEALAGAPQDWETSALSVTLQERGRAALAPWSRLILVDVPARLPAPLADDLLQRHVAADSGSRKRLSKALQGTSVDGPFPPVPASLPHRDEAGRQHSLRTIRDRAPAQMATDHAREEHLQRQALQAARAAPFTGNPDFIRREAQRVAERLHDARVAATCLAAHSAAERRAYEHRQQETAERQRRLEKAALRKIRQHGVNRANERLQIATSSAATSRTLQAQASARQQQRKAQQDSALREHLAGSALARASAPTPAQGLPPIARVTPAALHSAPPLHDPVASLGTAAGPVINPVQVTAQGHSVTTSVPAPAAHASPGASASVRPQPTPRVTDPATARATPRIHTLRDILQREGSERRETSPSVEAPSPPLATPALRAAPVVGTAAQAPLGHEGVRAYNDLARQRWSRQYYNPPSEGAVPARISNPAQPLGGQRGGAALQRIRQAQQHDLHGAP